ncbi:HEAT repeat domain-containing protein [Streptomyces sp. NRRL F-5126]|uniref:HEAT repeat domain-containing protein n=1 Tax=Streptomyces sp. NRRL F-5126 TaxID=1463857 RepID=UPI0004C9111B|nr:HEAT repeat domain-containing protein [Streptomyces sp. NRRL F-5126]
MNALDGTDASDADFLDLADRVREESRGSSTCDDLLRTRDAEKLATVLVAPRQPLWAREIAAYRLGCARDTRAFEALVLLLNHRDPERCVAASHALARLGDPRTPRAAAALATNPLRTAYALHPVRLLARLRAPESVPALITALDGLLAPGEPHWRVALACVEGLGALGDRRAAPVLRAALGHPRLAAAAGRALNSLA